MPLLELRDLSLHYGDTALLNGVDLTIEPRERICLLGRNGEGKSTLMRVVAGEIVGDDGIRQVADTTRIAMLPQDVPQGMQGKVYDIVASGLGALGQTLADYHHLLTSEPDALQRIAELQAEIDANDGWNIDARVETIISKLQLDGEARFSDLSGGVKRRVLLARALVIEPDILLLDEPTNHLDVGSITWLEEFLTGWTGSLMFITHDRAFLKSLATRIVELDRGVLTSWPGDYENFLRRRQAALDAEAVARSKFDRKLAEEEVWIRQGIQARRTRNEGRVRELKAMREELRQRREQTGRARLTVQEADRSARIISKVKDLCFSWNGSKECVVDGLSTDIHRGDRVGIIGPNGVGKTTLLNLLLGKLQPDSGNVRVGKRLQIAYFDQLREQLNENSRVFEAIADGNDYISLNNKPKHVLGYLQEFLFTPDRARQPIRSLSGGERSRLLLARLFTRPCNLLVLDEPTNDLDIETLDLLEERLLEFEGTLFVVSHDREFLNRVVTRSLVFEGNGRVGDYVGGYDDWLRQRRAPTPKTRTRVQSATPKQRSEKVGNALTWQERKELGALPGRIEALEARQAELGLALSDPALYRDQPDAARKQQVELSEVESEIEAAMARWEELEARN